MLRTLLAALAVALALPAAAPAAPLRRVRSSTTAAGYVVSHDDRFIATTSTTAGSPLNLIDTAGGPNRTLQPPSPGCTATDVRRGEVLWACPETSYAAGSGWLTDIDSGKSAPLPSPDPILNPHPAPDFDSVTYKSLGADWIGLDARQYHVSVEFFLNRTTGEFRADPTGDNPSQLADPDDPSLARSLCTGVVRPWVPGAFIDNVPGPLDHQGTWWIGEGSDGPQASTTGDRLTLQRCGHQRIVLRHEKNAVITWAAPKGFVAWTVQHGVELDVRTLRTGVTRRLHLDPADEQSGLYAVGAKLYIHHDDAFQRVLLGKP